jgi:Pentapeptide repeats (8 copies)
LPPDPDQVELLRRGPKAWNAWRENGAPLVPKLTGVALKIGEQQMGPMNGGPINLAYAELRGAFLRFANLSRANLEAADLSGADLAYARLDYANLCYADLSNAILDHADFAGAKLLKADLCGANLQMARDLTERQLYGTIGNAATILPPHLERPSSWMGTTAQSDGVPRSHKSQEGSSTCSKLTWKTAFILGAGGLIAAMGFWLLPGHHEVAGDRQEMHETTAFHP